MWPLLAATFGIAWRIAVLAYPHPDFEESFALRLAMAAMGLLFVGCGLWAWRRAPSNASWVFALYGAATGMHWGGPLGFGIERADVPLLVLYFAISSLAAQTLELHLAFAFPPSFRAIGQSAVRVALYVPTALAVLGTLALTVFGHSGTVGSTVLGVVEPLLVLGTFTGLAGLAVWIARRFTTAPAERARWRLHWVLAAIAVALVPGAVYLAGVSVGPLEGWINLGFIPLPLALAAALTAGRAPASR